MHRRLETWLLLSREPVDPARLWSAGSGSAAVDAACIIYSPARQLTTAPASHRIATTAVELAEMIAATAADRVLCVEGAHHADHDTHHQASPCSTLLGRRPSSSAGTSPVMTQSYVGLSCSALC